MSGYRGTSIKAWSRSAKNEEDRASPGGDALLHSGHRGRQVDLLARFGEVAPWKTAAPSWEPAIHRRQDRGDALSAYRGCLGTLKLSDLGARLARAGNRASRRTRDLPLEGLFSGCSAAVRERFYDGLQFRDRPPVLVRRRRQEIRRGTYPVSCPCSVPMGWTPWTGRRTVTGARRECRRWAMFAAPTAAKNAAAQGGGPQGAGVPRLDHEFGLGSGPRGAGQRQGQDGEQEIGVHLRRQPPSSIREGRPHARSGGRRLSPPAHRRSPCLYCSREAGDWHPPSVRGADRRGGHPVPAVDAQMGVDESWRTLPVQPSFCLPNPFISYNENRPCAESSPFRRPASRRLTSLGFRAPTPRPRVSRHRHRA